MRIKELKELIRDIPNDVEILVYDRSTLNDNEIKETIYTHSKTGKGGEGLFRIVIGNVRRRVKKND